MAAAVVALALALKAMLWSTPLGYHTPFVFLLGAIVLAAWYGGLGPALLVVLIESAAVAFFFVEPAFHFGLTTHTAAQLGGFVIEALAVGGLTCAFRSARLRAEAVAGRLERIHAMGSALVKAPSATRIAEILARAATDGLGAAWAVVYEARDQRSFGPIAHVGTDEQDMVDLRTLEQGSNPWIDRTLEAVDAFCVVGAAEIERQFPSMHAVSPAFAQAFLATRMEADGQLVGLLGLGFHERRRFGPEDASFVHTLARDCAFALERVRLLESEKRARIDAEEANRAKDQFLSIASHELRTPLTAIMSWAHLLKAGKAQPSSRPAEAILRCSRALARIVDDVLDASRITAEKLRIEPTRLNLGPLVRVTADELQQAAADKSIALDVSIEREPCVDGDAERLAQVVRNLVSNAIKFTPRGGHVWVDLRADGATARLRVRDDGKGIAHGDLPFVFEPFRQVDATSTRREGGLGLGLTIVRHLVKLHRGSVRIESPGLGRGTTATVELPCIDGATPELVPRDVGSPVSDQTLSGLRVLVVDDDPDVVDALRDILQGHGARVQRALSAREALEKLQESSPDILICDIGLPEEDGYSLIRKVRALATPQAHVPAIALTAFTRPEDVRAALGAGFQSHISKPADPDFLSKQVASVVMGGV